jgi:hypothetical protein
MGFFTKKTDPISQRARMLNSEIATLEAQIQRLTAKQEKSARKAPVASDSARPRSRRSNGSDLASPPPASEPVFEDLHRAGRRQSRSARKSDVETESADASRESPRNVRNLVRQVKGTPGSNPQLVNYLAAGSIQGLRPLRYEKRVARNRFLFLVIFLVLLLLGILTSFIRH